MKLDWTKCGRDWFGIYGQFRADVRAPDRIGPYGFYGWSVHNKDNHCGGLSPSVQAAKRASEKELERLLTRTE